MQLNAEDGGHRQCILVTNNENQICEEVTYIRNKKVIEGYQNAKGQAIEGLTNNNLRYFKCDFVGRQENEQNKRLLTFHSTDLLKIKEDCYEKIGKDLGFDENLCNIFRNDLGNYLIVLYHSRQQNEIIDLLIAWVKTTNFSQKIKLYAFASDFDSLNNGFEEVLDQLECVPLPEAIYNAYVATIKNLEN